MRNQIEYSAAEYLNERTQLDDYNTAQEYAFKHDVDASCFRFRYQEKMLVAVISPSSSDLAGFPVLRGIPATLDKEALSYLFTRKTAANKLGPWAEGHYRA